MYSNKINKQLAPEASSILPVLNILSQDQNILLEQTVRVYVYKRFQTHSLYYIYSCIKIDNLGNEYFI